MRERLPLPDAMTFQYAWLKILETLVRAKRPMSVAELQTDMASRGFPLRPPELVEGLRRLRDQGLVETLVLASGEPEEFGTVAITASGERKVRNIIRQ